MNICVFCSSVDVDQKYLDIAIETGDWISKNNHSLVYGGANSGMMGELASTVHGYGNKIIGVAPKTFNPNRHFDRLTELIVTETFSDRKKIMIESADAFIVIPGGIGTIDELFDILTLQRVKLLSKPLIVFNKFNFFSPIFDYLDAIAKESFLEKNYKDSIQIVESFDDISL